MKLNLGCGSDVKDGYVNVDNRDLPGIEVPTTFDSYYNSRVLKVDLSVHPWPWLNETADEIMMMDFLEHFPFASTDTILAACWRILKPGGKLVVQVPDFDHCSRAATHRVPFMCNVCGREYTDEVNCSWLNRRCKCGQSWIHCARSAIKRLYGGQDYPGNWHHTAFTEEILTHTLVSHGFRNVVSIKNNENGETLWQNWNIRLECKKTDLWGD